MRVNLRSEQRHKTKSTYTICWDVRDGKQDSAQVQGIDISGSGVRFRSPVELRPGTAVFIEGPEEELTGYAAVRHCTRLDGAYIVGVELAEGTQKPAFPTQPEDIDFYEFLQISPRAEVGTINRVYRFLAGRYHPDNPETGDPNKFVLLTHAFEVLSDPERRRAYDATRNTSEPGASPVLASIDYMDGVEGEINRRMAILSQLYNKRRTTPEAPGVSLFTIEKRMAFPREYLDFTTWYLRSKKYITVGDNSELVLTALGVDYVEANYAKIPVLNKMLLLKDNGSTPMGSGANGHGRGREHELLVLPAGETSDESDELATGTQDM
jgi:curved DNA-binding protein